MSDPDVRKDSNYVPLTKEQFRARFDERFYDPAFDSVKSDLDRVFEVAWDGYIKYRKSPRREKAGPGFADPDYDLPQEWLAARRAIDEASRRQADPKSRTRFLLINGSTRSQHSCPGEISKTRRLVHAARAALEASGAEVDELDLSLLAEEPYRTILPCKACVSTAMPLCHWPCSCYPNHAMGQTQDWMNEIYPRWAAAHGVMIVAPVHWYQVPAPLKAMMDRLVCADGGNPDPTTTGIKDPKLAKKIELAGWDYPKHLAGRAFSVFVHGDAAGTENVRRILVDWLTDMDLVDASRISQVDEYIGYYQPYATSHQALDDDPSIFVDVENAAKALSARVAEIRSGRYRSPDEGLRSPRQK